MEHFDESQLLAIGRVVVAAAQAEWMLAVLATCYTSGSAWDLLRTAGGAVRELEKAAERESTLSEIHEQATSLLAKRHRVVHDIAVGQYGDDGELPILLVTNRPAFESRPAPDADELNALADQINMLAAKALHLMPHR